MSAEISPLPLERRVVRDTERAMQLYKVTDVDGSACRGGKGKWPSVHR